jgi:hypothetical protein
MHFFVRDPNLDWNAKLDVPVFSVPKTNAGSGNAGNSQINLLPDPEDSILIAYGLNAEQEGSFSSSDKNISPFWKDIDETRDFISMTSRKNGTADAAFNFVLTHDCNMIVKAAYGADGIYLLFEINDDNDVAWPNNFVGTENEQFYLNFDAVDVLMDSRSIEEISNDMDKLVSRSFGLTFTSRQYQIACGTVKEPAAGFRRSLADPWDFNAKYYDLNDAKKKFGTEVENIKTSHFFKVQEWFIPWTEYGAGFTTEPEAGTRLAFSPGFNDRDEGEHFPPGRTSSGGNVKASNSIRWMFGSPNTTPAPASGR